jgi:hypothetical protein
MNSIYVILDKHTDLALNDLLRNNIMWIKDNFSIFLMESVPNDLTGEQAVNDFFKNLDYGFDCDACVQIGIISQEEGEFLRNPCRNDMSREAFINKRIEIITKIMDISAEKEYWMHYLGSLKRCEFYFSCLNAGICLRGMEPLGYKPALFSMNLRDTSMIQTIMSSSGSYPKPVLAMTGASHGINLIYNLCRFGQFGCHFIRLVTDDKHISPDSEFEIFRQNTLPNLKLGYAQEFSIKTISTDLPRDVQNAMLNELLYHYSGCALPSTLENDVALGVIKRRK